jgi:hypothetical protein
MSLRSVGDPLLQTAPSLLLASASTASLSLWVRVNPGNNVAEPSGVENRGEMRGEISATISDSGRLQIRWLPHNQNDSGNDSSGHELTLTPGTSHHIATVWQNSTQQYYLNGVEVPTGTQAGTMGVAEDETAQPDPFFSQSTGTDVTIDEATIWVGYALNAEEILDLRDRFVLPSEIASSSIALEWSLADGDGLAMGLNLSTIASETPRDPIEALPPGPPAQVGKASVGPSGKSIILNLTDSSGNPTNVSALRSANDIQTITLTGLPAGGSFPLTFNGQTTSAITVSANNPAVYALAALPVTAGTSYDVAFTWGIGNNGFASNVLCEVFDGAANTTLLGSLTVNETINGSSYTDQTTGNGTPLPWQTIGTFTPSGSTLTLRISSAGGLTVVDAARLKNNSSSAITYYDDASNVWTYVGMSSSVDQNRYLGEQHYGFGSGLGSVYRANPASIQTALQALSSVQPHSVTVTAADGSNDGPYTVTWVNAMRGVAQNPITTTATNVTIAHSSPGGNVATYSRNGATAVPIIDWMYGKTAPAYQPFIMAPLPQSAPPLQYAAANQGLSTFSGSYGFGPGNTGYSGLTSTGASGSTFVMTFSIQQLPPGSYQLSATWPPAALNATNTPFSVQDSSGNVLLSATIDQTAAPSGISDQGYNWTNLGTATVTYPNTTLNIVIKAATANGIVVGDGIRCARVGSDTSVVIGSSEVVTLTIPAGLITTVAGPIAAQTLTLTNLVGGSTLPTFVANTKTMKAGYNFEIINAPLLVYTNLARLIQQPIGGVVTFDVNGYPTVINAASINQVAVAGHGTDQGGSYLGLANLPNGLYTIRWDGACNVQGDQLGNVNMTENTSYQILSGTTNKQRVYNFQGRPGCQISPDIHINISGTTAVGDGSGNYHTDLQNLRIYPPDPSDPTGNTPWGTGSQVPPKWHPAMLAKLPTNGTLRFMDNMGTNNPGIADFTDFKQPSALSYSSVSRSVTMTGATVTGYTGPDTFWNIANQPVYLITTATPHGIKDRLYVTVDSLTTSVMSGGPGRTNPGGGSCVHVLSPTTFTMHWFEYQFAGQHMINTLTDGLIRINYQSYLPFTEMVDLCNTTSNDIWFNVGMAMTDACVTSIGNYLASNLSAGLKCRAEWGNECWNPGFQTYDLAKSLSASLGGSYADYTQGFTYYTAHAHALLKACFTAAGRPNDLIRVFGSFYGGQSNSTQPIATYAAANGIPIDVVALAPYYRNCSVAFGDEPSLYTITNVMTVDQDLDLFEQNIQYGGIQQEIAGHTAALVAHGFTTTQLACYEGGPDICSPYQDPSNFDRRNHAIVRHPRMYHIQMYHMQSLQDLGVTAYNDFYFSQGAFVQAGLGEFQWSAFIGWNQGLGTGNASLDTVNVSNPGDVAHVLSEVGGAIHWWASLTAGSSQRSYRSNLGRNGKIRTIGDPLTKYY